MRTPIEKTNRNEPSSKGNADVGRREFLTSAVAATVVASAGSQAWAVETKDGMPYRSLGRTGAKISAIGLGGYHIGKKEISDAESMRIIRTAIDGGITFMDNCWDYNDGVSEIRMGKVLRDGYRQKVFLMTKIDGRTREAAARQIDECLLRLQTDHIDLMQMHEVIRMEDPDRIFADGGAMEALVEAKQAGKIRYIGFTGHKDPLVHLRMHEIAAAHKFPFRRRAVAVERHGRSFSQLRAPRSSTAGEGPGRCFGNESAGRSLHSAE